jgi:large subunit ribosomal protein L24
MKIRKGDDVVVLAGKFRGERATVEAALPASNQVVLDSLNIAKRHTKQQGATMQAGIIDKFMPLHVSNVALWCGGHKGPAKVGFKDVDGAKVRVCRKCGGSL